MDADEIADCVKRDSCRLAGICEDLNRARAAADATGTLLVLADARVPAGDMIRFAGLAREAGVVHVEIAARRE